MGVASFIQNSFLGGIWSKIAQGRFDKPEYRTALYDSLNGFPLIQGPWTRRPGFLLGAQTNKGLPARTIEFAFQENLPYTCEFTALTLRFYSGYTLAMTNDAQTVVGITAANPAVVTAGGVHGWPAGATVMFNTLGTADPMLLNRQFTIGLVGGSPTKLTLTDAMTGITVDGSQLAAFTTGNITRVQTVTTPYLGLDWNALQLIPGDGLNGSDGTGILLHTAYPPQVLSVTTNPTTSLYAQLALTPASFVDGPYLSYVANGAEVTPSATSGIVSLVIAFATWSPTTAYSNGDFVTIGGVSYTSLADQNIGNPLTATFAGSGSPTVNVTNTYASGNEVIFSVSGGSLPVAITAGTVYYVIAANLSNSVINVSATLGGSAIDMATAGTGTATVSLAPGSNPSFWEVVSPSVSIGPSGFVQTDIGRHIRLASEPALWSSASTYALGASVTYGAQTYWTSLTASNTDNVPGVDTVHWAINPTGATWTWGKITSLLNFISGTVPGVVQIGNMSANGGLAAAFNGTPDQNAAASAEFSTVASLSGGQQQTTAGYAGQNYGAGSPSSYAIASAVIVPSTDEGLVTLTNNYGPSVQVGTLAATAYLYGSNSAPSSYNNGTLLGSAAIVSVPVLGNNVAITGTSPIVITSSDTATQYKYVWVAIVGVFSDTLYGTALICTLSVLAAQIEFVSAVGTGNSAGVNVEILGPPLLNTSAIRTWQLGLFNGTVGWPTCGTYHEGRLWLCGSVNNRLDSSQPNQTWDDQISFSPTNYDGTVNDDNAISYTLNAPSTNTIQWLKPDLQGIIVGTERGEWLVFATTLNAPLTPTNIDAHQVTRMGSAVTATALPVQTEHTTVFIQRFSRKLIEYFTDIFSGKFSAPDLAEEANHLTQAGNGLVEIAYQQNITPTIWGRTASGTLLGCTYKRDTLMSSQGPTAKGWHRHALGSGRSVTSLCVGPSPDGTLDTPVVVTAPVASSNDVYHVCFLNRIFEETDTIMNANFLDESIVNVSYSVVGNNLVIVGLWPLNGYSCDVWAGGLDCGTIAVSGGFMTVPLNATLTSAFIAAFSGAMPIAVGFTYTSQGQLLPPHAPPEAGTRFGPALAKTQRTHNLACSLVNTQGISFGTAFTDSIGGTSTMKAAELMTNNGEGTKLLPLSQLFTGTLWVPLTDPYSLSSKLCWKITRPYPATITVIGGTVQTSDQ